MFAAEPPPRKRISAGASLACASGPDSRHDHVDHDVAQDDDPAHAASSPAISAASRAFPSTSRTFASRLAPPVSRAR